MAHIRLNEDQSTKKDDSQTKDKPTPVSLIIHFPSDLLNAMIHKTDIGIIPRSPPKEHHLSSPYSSSPNWLKQIKGCYWCSNKSKTASGDDNFCTYRCYLIFYEWCVRKVYAFTGVKMCRDTGCNRIAADGFDCCTKEHTKAIEEKYSSVKKVDLDRLCNNVGPNFYKKCDVPNITPEVGTTKLHTQPQPPVTPSPHPQQNISLTHYSPPLHSKTQPISPKPQSIMVLPETPSLSTESDISLPETEREGVLDVSPSDYSNPFLDPIPIHQEISTSPPTKSHTELITYPNPFSLLQTSNESTTLIHPIPHPFTLSHKLTDLLAQRTDVGIIPRNKYQQQSAVISSQYSDNRNWSADITSCCWCELSNTSFHELTCDKRCWLLFHEWCVRKVETECGVKLCVLPGCENSRVPGCSYCSLEHYIEISKLRGTLFPSTEEEVELTLGPDWYTDLSPIYFSKTGAFYEFSNYFPSLLLLNGFVWPTVYHYLSAQKLIGTPYGNQICEMELTNELERWMKRRTLKKWVRPDWDRICEGVTHNAVFTKFSQNKVLRGMLLKTGKRPLVCNDGSLGGILVGLREWFRTYRDYSVNQPFQNTKMHLTPNVSVDTSEIVSETPPPVTAEKSLTQEIIVPKCEQPIADDIDLNDEVADTILASLDTDSRDDDFSS